VSQNELLRIRYRRGGGRRSVGSSESSKSATKKKESFHGGKKRALGTRGERISKPKSKEPTTQLKDTYRVKPTRKSICAAE